MVCPAIARLSGQGDCPIPHTGYQIECCLFVSHLRVKYITDLKLGSIEAKSQERLVRLPLFLLGQNIIAPGIRDRGLRDIDGSVI